MSTAIPFHDAHLASFKAVRTEDDGSLVVRGWGANYDLDREDEYFVDGAFRTGLRRFLDGPNPVLCYHHKMDTPIGRVIDAKEVSGKGVEITAVVDHQPEGSPWRHIYQGIKNGRIASFSVGGIFKRVGNKIVDVDILEWSATPVPVGRGTDFAIVAGKAISEGSMDKDDELERLRAQVEALTEHARQAKAMPPAGIKLAQPQHRQATGGQDGVWEVNEDAPVQLSELDRIEVEKRWTEHRTRAVRAREKAEREADENGWSMLAAPPIPLSAPAWFRRKEGQKIVTETREVDEGPNPHLPEGWKGPQGFDAFGRPVVAPERDLTPEQQLQLDQASEEERPGVLARIKATLTASPIRIRPAETGPQTTRRVVKEPTPEEIFAAMAEAEKENDDD